MKRTFKIILVVFSFSLLIFTSCEKDPEIKEPDKINSFIWTGLHDYYLWNEKVPNLVNYNPNTSSLNSFLNKYSDHEKLFYDLLYDYERTDKWSWIVEDYEELEKEFEGITKSMGYIFRLAEYGTEKKVLGFVLYVVKGSPADLAGIKRGNIFTKVNDQFLTTTNYLELLTSDSYKLSFVNLVNNTLILNGQTANVTAVEINENPIFLDTVYNINNQKIGYLIYNSFTSTYDKALNNVMLKFKNAGITKLILDLRYNGGGSLESSTYLASMIYGTNTSKVFLKTEYNDLLQEYLTREFGTDYLNVTFESQIANEDNSKTPINTLNLSDVYIITTDNTASASESVINGLKPYMSVITVGTNTHGKYVGSITVKDYIDDEGTVNPAHKWALQPIVLKVSNSIGISDYLTGFAPSIVIEEDIANLSILGDLREPLLNKTITAITGVTSKSAKIPSGFQLKSIPQLEINRKTEMYFNKRQINFDGFGK